jgi:hypothetical protein
MGIAGLIVAAAAGAIYLSRLKSPAPTVSATSSPATVTSTAASPPTPSTPTRRVQASQASSPAPSPAAAVAVKPAPPPVRVAPQQEPAPPAPIAAQPAPLAPPPVQAQRSAARHQYSLMSQAEAEKLAKYKISQKETPPGWAIVANGKMTFSGVKVDETGFIVVAMVPVDQFATRIWLARGNLDTVWPAMTLPEVEDAHRRIKSRQVKFHDEMHGEKPAPGFLFDGLLWLSNDVEIADGKALAPKDPFGLEVEEVKDGRVTNTSNASFFPPKEAKWDEVKPVISKGVHLWYMGPLGALLDGGTLIAVNKPITNIAFENGVMPEVRFTLLNQPKDGVRVEFGGTGFEMRSALVPGAAGQNAGRGAP